MAWSKAKSNLPLGILVLAVAVTAVYVYAARHLLQTILRERDFVRAEITGLADYQQVLNQYFEISQKGIEAADTAILRQQIRTIGDRSNLILDPALRSYYATAILFVHIPRLLESHNEPLSPIAREELAHALKILGEGDDASTPALDQLVSEVVTGNAQQGQLAAIRHLSQQVGKQLEQMLTERLRLIQQQLSSAIAIMAALYVGLMSAALIALRNYVGRTELEAARKRQQLMDQLAVKNRELEEFTYAAAHDLKEPLRTLRCYASLLKQEIDPAQEQQESFRQYVGVLESTAGRAEQMIHDLLRYSELSAQDAKAERCDCEAQLKLALEDLAARIEATHARVNYTNLPVISAAPVLFRRVLMNLLDNAMQYCPPNRVPTIEIGATMEAGNWIFHVEDNGEGIPEPYRQQVFEAFRRLQPETHPEGTGIGLTACRKMVEMMGGRIRATDRSDGREGCRMEFSIPAK